MSPSTAFFLGIFAGFMIVSITAWWAVTWFRDDPQRIHTFLAQVLRSFARESHRCGVLVSLGDGPTVVPFSCLASAIETGRFITLDPVRVTRSDRPPPYPPRHPRRSSDEDPTDGTA